MDLEESVACTLVYVGEDAEQRQLEWRVMRRAKKFGGFGAGGVAGKDGYNLTASIAYIRDFLLQYWTLGDSFETVVPWGKVDHVVDGVRTAVEKSHSESALDGHAFVTARVSQVYQIRKTPMRTSRDSNTTRASPSWTPGARFRTTDRIGRIRAEYLDRLKSPGGPRMESSQSECA